MIRVPSIGIGPTTVSTVCLYLLYSRLFPPGSTSNFYQKYKVLLRNASELAIRHGITHRILRIDSILSKEDNGPTPVLLY